MINNTDFNVKTAEKIPMQKTSVFRATESRQFAHHPFICKFKDNFIAMFSSGKIHEDDLGQRVALSYSKDFLNWTEPVFLEVTGKYDSVDTACGMYVFNDKLYLYVGTFFYDRNHVKENGERVFEDKGHTDTKLYVVESSDGVTFSEPVFTGLKMVPNMPPKRLKNGKTVICGNFLFAVNDEFENRPNNWKTESFCSDLTIDDSESFYRASEKAGLNTVVCESDLFEKDDETFVSLFRSQKKEYFGYLYASESKELKEWTLPVKTDFTNDTSKFCVGRLADGKYYYVGNPVVGNGRCPLVMSVSVGGENFTEHYILTDEKPSVKYKGFAKFGACAYPYAFEDGDYFYVIYSVNKEDVQALRFKTNELNGNKRKCKTN